MIRIGLVFCLLLSGVFVLDTAHGAERVHDLTDVRPGSTLELRVGDVIELRLDGNASSGYRWSFVDTGEGVLVDTGERSISLGGREDRRVGSGSSETWRLRAARSGRQIAIFEYRRPWETEVAATRTVSWDVRVSD